jgi:hypothetical protein
MLLEFKRTEIVSRGGMSEGQPPPFKPKDPVPTEETKLESVNRLLVDGEKVRFENNHPTWHMPDGKLVHPRRIFFFDGSIPKRFYPEGMAGGGEPFGGIESSASQQEIMLFVLTPITMAVRGLNSSMCPYVYSEMKATGVTVPIDGVMCEEHIIESSPGKTRSCWLDPKRDYAVRRIRTIVKGKLERQMEIRYQQSEDLGSIPSAWVVSDFSPTGAVRTTNTIETLSFRFNAAQDPKEFEFQFPAGCEVYDQRNDKHYRVQSDGTMREFSPAGEHLNVSSVSQPGDTWFRRHKWLLVGLSVACLALIAGYMGPRLRKAQWRRDTPGASP